MKKQIDLWEYAGHILKAMEKGILLTTRSGQKVNTMTIGWGKLGIEWNKHVFIAYVRESRYTKQLLEETGEFTVNIPLGDYDSSVLRYCGTKSGRDTDKIQDMQLQLEESMIVSVPGIVQYPLTLECRIIFKQRQEPHTLPENLVNRFYPIAGEETVPDRHIAYYGEIVNAYLITR